MPEARLEDERVEYDIRRSERASRSRIDIDLSGVTVVIPEGKEMDPEEFLQEKRDWVLEKRGEIEDYWARVPERDFEKGEIIPYLGEDHEIKVTKDDRYDVVDRQILIPEKKLPESSLKDAIEELYREKVREKIREIIEEYAKEIGVDFNRLYIRNQKTKWASCSPKDNLSFNWRLMMAPEEVLEYVVVHELIHLEEPTHSDRFWSLMGEILPDYRKRRDWLKENSPELVFSEEDLL